MDWPYYDHKKNKKKCIPTCNVDRLRTWVSFCCLSKPIQNLLLHRHIWMLIIAIILFRISEIYEIMKNPISSSSFFFLLHLIYVMVYNDIMIAFATWKTVFTHSFLHNAFRVEVGITPRGFDGRTSRLLLCSLVYVTTAAVAGRALIKALMDK